MKKYLVLCLACFSSCLPLLAQKFPPMDKSPMDMAYYPVDYPILKIQNKITEPLVARVIYSRPQKNGRTVFGGLNEWGKVWRFGANEATEIEFFQNVLVGGKAVPKGRYTLCTIPDSTQWTIIVNKETDTWGSFKYDEKKDQIRVDVPVQKTPESLEALAMYFSKTDAGFALIAGWENAMVTIPMKVNEKAPAPKPVKKTK
ncbi:MAG: DUF2911 domain-containing protein [Williamsia sp.]|nr:DUF2911 domain-containing protein [Williamsia sp.]